MIYINHDLKRSCNKKFQKTAAHGHFGCSEADITWEFDKHRRLDQEEPKQLQSVSTKTTFPGSSG
uniref:S-adenosylmethionine synthetase C-terminal domain-containing protein n=1 Tax=Physcomitrium patens TaxID=3218 RepID=A0A2K1JRF7_PHYPA|nr:hypothetical protein PHYPA_016508 [Physcomitrium patens]